MFKALVFAGTTEGRQLAEFCAESHIDVDFSVASERGGEIISAVSDKFGIFIGKKNSAEIKELISRENYGIVFDATHPYAVEVSKNISKACSELNVELFRVMREKSTEKFGLYVKDHEELITLLNGSDKPILSTLGSKEAAIFRRVKNFRERVWLRILPDEKAIEYCLECGLRWEQIITGCGPFSVEENLRDLRASNAGFLITKDSGKIGGYPEKTASAKELGVTLVTIDRPDENGISLADAVRVIRERSGKT